MRGRLKIEMRPNPSLERYEAVKYPDFIEIFNYDGSNSIQIVNLGIEGGGYK